MLEDLQFWHGARNDKPVAPGVDGLIFLSTDEMYAQTFIDPLRLLSYTAKPKKYRVSIEKPKYFSCSNDNEWLAFTERGISRDSLTQNSFDSAILLAPDGSVVDVALTSPQQLMGS